MEYSISKVLSEGFTYGSININKNNECYIAKGTIEEEIEKLNIAINKALIELNEMEKENESLLDYISIQRLMILDVSLHNKIHDNINNGLSAMDAIYKAMDEFVKPLEDSDDSYLKERAIDMIDARDRIIGCLTNKKLNKLTDKYILYVDRLYPTYLINNRKSILGVIAANGGYTSHAAIMCRAWGIPYVVANIELADGQNVIIDTDKNIIIANPTNIEIEKYNNKGKDKKLLAIDHSDYLFLANVSSNEELQQVVDYKLDGVGLYRTEFIFMNNTEALSYDQQYQIYLNAVNICKELPICFRTFDISEDKQLPYLKSYPKSYYNYINNPKVFEDQVLAILKSNIYGNTSIMFPMIDSIAEYNYLKNWMIKLQQAYNCNLPKIGITIETKKAFESYKDFINVDFISLGTNDLISQLYGIDRNSELDINIIDDFIEKLKPIVEFSKINNISLSICGEIASIEEIAIKLYRIGIKNLSISPILVDSLNNAYKEYMK